jgi:hypothetical protein
MSLIIFAIICLIFIAGLVATGAVLEKDKNKLETEAKEKRKLRFFRPKSGLKRFTWSSQKDPVTPKENEDE